MLHLKTRSSMVSSMLQLNKALQKRIENLKVLIVDDQAEVRTMIRDMLDDIGISRIYEASNGKEAIQFIDTDFDAIELIICDWNMPTMNGIDFLKQIRSVFPDVPFLMITGKSDKSSVVEAKTSGVSAYIRKPFSPDQLEKKLAILFSGKETDE